MAVTNEAIQALAKLREFARDESRNSLNSLSRETAEAVDILDNAGVFREIDEQTGYDVEGKG